MTKKIYTQEEVNEMTETKMKSLFEKDSIRQRFYDNKETQESIVKNAIAESDTQKTENVYSSEIVKELKKRADTIHRELGKVESSFQKIAFNLYWIYSNKSYKALGYDDIYSLASGEFSIARGTANNFINIVERFGKRIDDKITDEIANEFKGYKSSQLITMLGMDEEQIKKIDSSMSVRDIKKIKKETSADSDSKPTEETQKSTVKTKPIDVKSTEINRTVMITVKDLDDYKKHMDMIETQIVRALSVRGKNYKVEIAYTW